MATLVLEQDDSVQQIEASAETTKNDVESGYVVSCLPSRHNADLSRRLKQTQKAVKSAMAARKKRYVLPPSSCTSTHPLETQMDLFLHHTYHPDRRRHCCRRRGRQKPEEVIADVSLSTPHPRFATLIDIPLSPPASATCVIAFPRSLCVSPHHHLLNTLDTRC